MKVRADFRSRRILVSANAAMSNGGVKLTDDGVILELEIISPEGSRVSHEAKAREGNYFSCDIPFDEIGEFR